MSAPLRPNVIVGFCRVRHFQLCAVPLDTLSQLRGDVAKQQSLGNHPGKFEVAAGLGLLSWVPTELIMKVMEGDRHDLVLIPCKSAGLGWPAVEAILTNRPIKYPIDELTLKLANRDYGKLSVDTAQRTLRFWQIHNKIGK